MAVAPRVDLAPDRLDAVPGEPATFTLEVFNPSEIIEGYRVILRGLPPEAVTAVPEHLNLFPGETGTMTFTLVLPPTFAAGSHAIGVEVETGTAPVERWTGVLNLEVAAVPGAALRADPAALTGGRQVETSAILSNLGNDEREFVLTGADPEHATLVDVSPARVRLGPGAESRSRVSIRAGRNLVGSPILRLVTVTAFDGTVALEAPVSYTQKPLIPRTLLTALAVLALLALWAGILLFGLGQIVQANRPETEEVAAPATGTVSGRVAAADSRLLAGISVEAFADSDVTAPVAAASTAADGRYTITGLPAGAYFVRFSSDGRTDHWYDGAPTPVGARRIELVPTGIEVYGVDLGGDSRGVNAILDQEGAVAGRAADATGRGLTGIAVTASLANAEDPEAPPLRRRVFEFPLFRLGGLPSPALLEVAVSKVGFADTVRRVPLFAGEDAELGEIVLDAGSGAIAGAVTDAAGQPLAGVDVVISDGLTEATVETDATGAFAIDGLHAPRSYKLTFAEPAYETQTALVDVALDAPTDDVVVVLAGSSGTIFGSVWGGDGAVGDVTVTIAGGDTMVATTTGTEKENLGEFLVTGLPTPNVYTVTFEKDGLKPTVVIVEMEPGDPPVEVVVEPEVDVAAAIAAGDAEPGAIFGVVSDTDGDPVAGVTVTITDGENELMAMTSDDPPGRYEVAGFETAGTFTVTFTAEGFATKRILTDLDIGQQLELNTTITREGPLPVSALVLSVDGIGPFPFGTDGADVIAALTETFGDGDVVAGPAGVCPSDPVRYVRFGALLIMLLTGNAGAETFVGYRVDGQSTATPADELATVSGLAIRQTVEELNGRFTGGGIEVRLVVRDGTDFYELRRVSDDALLLWGPLSGTTDTDTVAGIYAPDPCTGG